MKKCLFISIILMTFYFSSFSQKIREVKIGSQVWMAENLNVDKFRNGDPIRQVKTNAEWSHAGENKEPAWCYYKNQTANGLKYGKLYNWYAIIDPRGLAPEGWHVPSNTEWMQLINNLGVNAGTKFKSQKGWGLNNNGSNSSGFSGIPGGFRNYIGEFHTAGFTGYWWTALENDSENAIAFFMASDLNDLISYNNNKTAGLSVRCVKDNNFR